MWRKKAFKRMRESGHLSHEFGATSGDILNNHPDNCNIKDKIIILRV